LGIKSLTTDDKVRREQHRECDVSVVSALFGHEGSF